MIPILSLLVVVALSLIVTRIASVALEHTGLGRESARFQARSALTGVGFTTGESEGIVNDPVRRRIVSTLMLFGNVGIVTASSSLLLSFIGMRTGHVGTQLAFLAGGLLTLWLLATSRWIDDRMCQVITWARDYARLLHVREEHGVSSLTIEADGWLCDQTLRATELRREGVLVLGIECPGGSFIGAPAPDTRIRAGDRVVLYGRNDRLHELCSRAAGPGGDRAHGEAADTQRTVGAREHLAAGR